MRIKTFWHLLLIAGWTLFETVMRTRLQNIHRFNPTNTAMISTQKTEKPKKGPSTIREQILTKQFGAQKFGTQTLSPRLAEETQVQVLNQGLIIL